MTRLFMIFLPSYCDERRGNVLQYMVLLLNGIKVNWYSRAQVLHHLLEVSMLYIQVLKLQLLGQLLQEDLLEKK